MQPVSAAEWPKCVKNLERNFRKILSPGQNFQNLPIWSEAPGCTLQSAKRHPSTSELYTNGAYSFSPQFFTRFGHPTIKNSDSVLSTEVRPVDTFDHGAIRSHVWYFRPCCDYFPISLLSTFGCTAAKNSDSVFAIAVQPGG